MIDWTKKTATRPQNQKPVETVFNGPLWLPQHTLLGEKERNRLVSKACEKNPNSAATETIEGVLVAINAYGRQVYGIDVGDGVEVKVPEQGVLYSRLQAIDHTMKPRIFIEFKGRGEAVKKGQSAPFLYDVIPCDDASAKAVVGKARNKHALEKQSGDGDNDGGKGNDLEEPDHVKGDGERG